MNTRGYGFVKTSYANLINTYSNLTNVTSSCSKLANMIDNSSKIANLISIYSNFKSGIDLIKLFNFVTVKFCKCDTHLMNFPNGFCLFAQTIKILKLG